MAFSTLARTVWFPQICGFVVLILATTGLANEAFAKDRYRFDPPKVGHIREQTSRLLKDHAKTFKSDPTDLKSTLRLCNWYVAIRSDARYDESRTIQTQAIMVRQRLRRVADSIRRRLSKHDFRYEQTQLDAFDSAIKGFLSELQSGDSSSGNSSSDPSKGRGTPDSDQKPPSGNAAPGELDQAAQLLELIEKIVKPDFWNTQGGPGVLHYYAARRVLVVRATSDVHEALKDLLIALR